MDLRGASATWIGALVRRIASVVASSSVDEQKGEGGARFGALEAGESCGRRKGARGRQNWSPTMLGVGAVACHAWRAPSPGARKGKGAQGKKGRETMGIGERGQQHSEGEEGEARAGGWLVGTVGRGVELDYAGKQKAHVGGREGSGVGHRSRP